MTSCATIMNKSLKKVQIYTSESSKIIYKQDTVSQLSTKTTILVERKNKAIAFLAIGDSLRKTVRVEPRNSFSYFGNILCNAGIGMLVDQKNPKRYTYPSKVYVDFSEKNKRHYWPGQAKQGEIYAHYSLPHINSFLLRPEGEEAKINTGFWGLTLGLDYYHLDEQYFRLRATGVSDFPSPFPFLIFMRGEYELMSSWYFSFSNNHSLGRMDLGYGLYYGKNTWDLIRAGWYDPPTPARAPINKSHHTIGLVFPMYYRASETFSLGLVYRPSFFRPNLTEKFKYEHLISFDFAWKIRLKK
jgi:hypothetical protein